jgi:hypothetical protein
VASVYHDFPFAKAFKACCVLTGSGRKSLPRPGEHMKKNKYYLENGKKSKFLSMTIANCSTC